MTTLNNFTQKSLEKIPAFEYRGAFVTQRIELLAAVERVLDSGYLILGPEVAQFEIEFASFVGAAHAVGVSSGTDAILIALRALDIGHGDEVITVSNGPVPTSAAIRAVGATPKFVDIDPATLQIDPAQVARAISPRTRCVLPLHLYGYPANVPALAQLCQRHQLELIEDCAQAHGTRLGNQHVGLFGRVGCFSFYPTKNLGGFGDAGMCVTNDSALAAKMRELSCYGFRGDRIAHSEGLNCRLDELQAALLRVRLKHLPHALAQRAWIAESYWNKLKSMPFELPCILPHGTASWHQFVIRTNARARLIEHLAQRNVDVGIHYANAVHTMPAYADPDWRSGSLMHTQQACAQVLSLPIYPELTEHQVERVIAALAEAPIAENSFS